MWPLLADIEEAALPHPTPTPFFFSLFFLIWNEDISFLVSGPFILFFLQVSSHGSPRHIQANT